MTILSSKLGDHGGILGLNSVDTVVIDDNIAGLPFAFLLFMALGKCLSASHDIHKHVIVEVVVILVTDVFNEGLHFVIVGCRRADQENEVKVLMIRRGLLHQ